MLTQEMVVTIKVLKKQGKPIKAIARDTGVSRNTVKKYLHQASSTPRYGGARKRPSKLDPYKDYLHRRIAAAHPDWIPAVVLYDEIIAQGYTGKIRILRSYLAGFKSAPRQDPLVRFETPPGHQMQVDFTIIRRGHNALKAFVATLGYSRASYVHFYEHERTSAWIDGLKRACDFFGGVPNEVLFDNAKAIMIERDAYEDGEHRWNPQLRALANDYGFRPRVCRPYRAKTKGKVERFNRYLKSSFIVPLNASLKMAGLHLDVQSANAHIGPWLTQTANTRIHCTTGESPSKRLRQERLTFLPLPMTLGNPPADQQRIAAPLPVESLQHPLSLYDEMLGGTHELTV